MRIIHASICNALKILGLKTFLSTSKVNKLKTSSSYPFFNDFSGEGTDKFKNPKIIKIDLCFDSHLQL